MENKFLYFSPQDSPSLFYFLICVLRKVQELLPYLVSVRFGASKRTA